jgi:hypothetical protein
MTDQQKQTQNKDGIFKDKALEAKKNKRAMWAGSLTMAAAAAVFALWQSCGGQEGPCSSVKRADGRCAAACEALEFMLNKDGTRMLDREGNAVKNPFYSWEDCHDTNGRCEDDRRKVVGMDGAPLELVTKDAFGRPYQFQPESADPSDPNFSIDCVRLQCGSQCGEKGDQKCPTIEGRPLIGPDTKVKRLVWDTENQQEVEVERPATPYLGLADLTNGGRVTSRAKEGNRILTTPIRSAYWRIWNYEERCPTKKNKELDDCGPLTEGPCLCSNHSSCAPAERSPPKDKCEDGKKTDGEQCDESDPRYKRGGCTVGYSCLSKKDQRMGKGKACTCMKDRLPPPDVCNDGKKTGKEQCDGSDPRYKRGGCPPGQSCRTQKEGPHDACTCTQPLQPCPADVRAMAQAKDLRDTVRGIFRENAGSLRQKVGADPKDRVTLSTQLTIENGKVVSIRRISGKCTGECSTSTKLSKKDILDITGKLDVVGEAAPQTRSKCYISISYSPRQ